jgi:hypothetical protein
VAGLFFADCGGVLGDALFQRRKGGALSVFDQGFKRRVEGAYFFKQEV